MLVQVFGITVIYGFDDLVIRRFSGSPTFTGRTSLVIQLKKTKIYTSMKTIRLRKFNSLETALVNGFELTSEEHRSDVREDERLVLLDHH